MAYQATLVSARAGEACTHRRSAAGGAADRGAAAAHTVVCPYCATPFDLFDAAWCAHVNEPSKVCPRCDRCLCQHPAYQEPHFWKEAPLAFQRHGFQRLFLYYL